MLLSSHLQIEDDDEFPFSIPEVIKEIEAAYSADPFFETSRTAGDLNCTDTADRIRNRMLTCGPSETLSQLPSRIGGSERINVVRPDH